MYVSVWCVWMYDAGAANEASLPTMLAKMNETGSYYLIRSMDPNGLCK
jgi:hypothetical protein